MNSLPAMENPSSESDYAMYINKDLCAEGNASPTRSYFLFSRAGSSKMLHLNRDPDAYSEEGSGFVTRNNIVFLVAVTLPRLRGLSE